MKIKTIIYKNVAENGSVPMGGAVHTGRRVTGSFEGGCSIPGCNCSPTPWICATMGRDSEGTVKVLSATMEQNDTRQDFDQTMSAFEEMVMGAAHAAG